MLEVSLRVNDMNWTKEQPPLEAPSDGFSPIYPGGHRDVLVLFFLADEKQKGFPEGFFQPDYLQGFPIVRVKVTKMPEREAQM